MKKSYKGALVKLSDHLKEIREIYLDCSKYVVDKNDGSKASVGYLELKR